jgi:hypothetical protein
MAIGTGFDLREHTVFCSVQRMVQAYRMGVDSAWQRVRYAGTPEFPAVCRTWCRPTAWGLAVHGIRLDRRQRAACC